MQDLIVKAREEPTSECKDEKIFEYNWQLKRCIKDWKTKRSQRWEKKRMGLERKLVERLVFYILYICPLPSQPIKANPRAHERETGLGLTAARQSL